MGAMVWARERLIDKVLQVQDDGAGIDPDPSGFLI